MTLSGGLRGDSRISRRVASNLPHHPHAVLTFRHESGLQFRGATTADELIRRDPERWRVTLPPEEEPGNSDDGPKRERKAKTKSAGRSGQLAAR